MLLVRVFVDCGLVAPFDPRPYPIDWHLHRSEERYLGFIFERAARSRRREPGDVVVFRYGRCYTHGGIVTAREPLTIVHAFWPARRVLEEEVAHNSRIVGRRARAAFFSYWATAMSLFARRQEVRQQPDYTGLQIQTSVNALPIPIVWGESQDRAERDLVQQFPDPYATEPRAAARADCSPRDDRPATTYTRRAHYGALRGADRRHQPDLARPIGLHARELGLSLFTGTTPQSVWSYLATAYPSQALAYQGTAYVCAANYNSAIPRRSPTTISKSRGSSTAPASTASTPTRRKIVDDFLTNAQYGVGFPAGSIDATTLFGSGGDASYQTYCTAVGFALSPALTNQEQASSIWRAGCSSPIRPPYGRADSSNSFPMAIRDRRRHGRKAPASRVMLPPPATFSTPPPSVIVCPPRISSPIRASLCAAGRH